MNRRMRAGRVIAIGLPLTAFILLLPWLSLPYLIVWMFLFSISLALAVSYDIVGGYMGYMNLGHAVFFGLGAYTAGLGLNNGVHLVWSLAAAALVSAGFAAVVSFPLFRLRGAYFALGTFGLVGLMGVLCRNLRDVTGGSGGLSVAAGDHSVGAYYLSVGLAAATIFLSRAIVRSRFGLGLLSIRDDEEASRAFGTPTTLYKILALVVSSIPASLAGAIYVWNVTYISPSSVFGLETALSPIVMALLGGTGTLFGPILGTFVLTVLQELLWTKVPYLHLTTYGIIMILVGLFMPGGLVRTRFFQRVVSLFSNESITADSRDIDSRNEHLRLR